MTNLLGAKSVCGRVWWPVPLYAMQGFLPMIIFLVAAFLAFATGTSWGTFSILIPIVSRRLPGRTDDGDFYRSPVWPGAVCGDHCSPISDTTIMASAGAHCEHVNHVSTQLPYAMVVAAVCLTGYFLIGIFQAAGLEGLSLLALPVCIVLLIGILLAVRKKTGREEI